MKIAIIEDEVKMAAALKNLIAMAAPGCEITGVADNIKSGVELITVTSPDLVFMDVEIKDGLSFEILKRLPAVNFQLVFVTAHSHYAVTAFEYSAIDYIVKPVNPDNIMKAITRAKSSIDRDSLAKKIDLLLGNIQQNPVSQKIVLQTSESVYYVTVKEIIRCEADNNYCRFILENGDRILVSRPLKEYEQLLPSTYFVRIHQSHLINLGHVKQIKKLMCKVVLTNGDQIPFSSRRKEELLMKLKAVQ